MLGELKAMLSGFPSVKFTGRVQPKELPLLYSLADLFVFPSTMDTFGMAVLEAQACGLVALVTDIGGPQEVIADGQTGRVLPSEDVEAWAGAVLGFQKMLATSPEKFEDMQKAARLRAIERFNWDEAIDDIFQTQKDNVRRST